ncbi:hypothetical protein [Aquicella lusitana]|uniref:Uncharacterized protein n=1 Tax=Aquicella lusitana TaxID=254246 RepID=A0A370GQM1_9COXI|nr:hypothetical protein [Aquicella lusitana]RDI46015.1 hypothetical protein C8D86_10619 [Aquicella lusitana]VVC73388.1 hypothetical protein AQULUS_11270 [Aquicella lusitana]
MIEHLKQFIKSQSITTSFEPVSIQFMEQLINQYEANPSIDALEMIGSMLGKMLQIYQNRTAGVQNTIWAEQRQVVDNQMRNMVAMVDQQIQLEKLKSMAAQGITMTEGFGKRSLSGQEDTAYDKRSRMTR